LRQSTACRKRRSALLFVGSSPSTRVNVHKARSRASNSRQVAAVLGQRERLPRANSSRNE